MSDAARVLDWNGHDLPGELAALPPGRYVIERLEPIADWKLSTEETEGLERAARTLDHGEGVPWSEVRARLQTRIAEATARKPTST